MCSAEVVKGFYEGCRSFIGVDGCHLRNGTPEILLGAIGKDGNDQMFLVAWAIEEGETKETWTWFLTHLLDAMGDLKEHCVISCQIDRR